MQAPDRSIAYRGFQIKTRRHVEPGNLLPFLCIAEFRIKIDELVIGQISRTGDIRCSEERATDGLPLSPLAHVRRNGIGRPLIAVLLRMGCPFTIPWLIVSIVVHAFDSESFRWLAHISHKIAVV